MNSRYISTAVISLFIRKKKTWWHPSNKTFFIYWYTSKSICSKKTEAKIFKYYFCIVFSPFFFRGDYVCLTYNRKYREFAENIHLPPTVVNVYKSRIFQFWSKLATLSSEFCLNRYTDGKQKDLQNLLVIVVRRRETKYRTTFYIAPFLNHWSFKCGLQALVVWALVDLNLYLGR